MGLGVLDFLSICREIIIVIKTAKSYENYENKFVMDGVAKLFLDALLTQAKMKVRQKVFCLFKLELKYPISRVISFLVNHRNM